MPVNPEDMIQLLMKTNADQEECLKEKDQTISDLRATVEELRNTVTDLRSTIANLKIPDTFYFRRGDPQFLTDSFVPQVFHRCITVRAKTFRFWYVTFDIPDGDDTTIRATKKPAAQIGRAHV